jgi:hypothetical protein
MSQRRFEGILFCLVGKVIAACTEVPCGENRTSCDFPFQVEVILQCVWEPRMIGCLDEEYRLREYRILRAGKTGKEQSIYAEKRSQEPIGTKQVYREQIAKDATSAAQYGLAISGHAPGEAKLW